METCSTCEPWLASPVQPRNPQRSLRKSTTTYITHLSLHISSHIIEPDTHSKELQRSAPTPKPTLQRLQDARHSPNTTATRLYGFEAGLSRRKRGTFSTAVANLRQHHRPEHRRRSQNHTHSPKWSFSLRDVLQDSSLHLSPCVHSFQLHWRRQCSDVDRFGDDSLKAARRISDRNSNQDLRNVRSCLRRREGARCSKELEATIPEVSDRALTGKARVR